MECKIIRPKKRRLCTGDLDRRIDIYSRTLNAPSFDVDFDHTFNNKKTVWSALESVNGRDTFYLTNLDQKVSHIFYVRWYAGLTAESWINFKSELYDIIQVENLDERDEWYSIYCNVRGDEDAGVNSA